MPRMSGRRSALSDQIERTARRLSAVGRLSQAQYSREFEGLLALLSARIAGLIRQYRLCDMRDDAQQAAAIGVHRALASFDPDKARFTTHVTWQIRGELQSLRHRMRLDQRNSARNAGITTCSLDDLNAQPNENAPFEIVDESAVCRTESGASDGMALALMDRLLTTLDAPETEREIVRDHLFDAATRSEAGADKSPEQRRQIVRRTLRNCAKVLAA